MIKNFCTIIILTIVGVLNLQTLNAQTTLSCGQTNCNGDTRRCASGFTCTYLGVSVCSGTNTICVPVTGTSDGRGTIPNTDYLGQPLERTRCTSGDTGNNYLYSPLAPTKVWTSTEVIQYACTPPSTTGGTTTSTTGSTTSTTTGGATTSTTGTTSSTTSSTTGVDVSNTTGTLPNTSSDSNNIHAYAVSIIILSIVLILFGLSLRRKLAENS